MTDQKKQKRIIRTRAAESGVSYSVARRNMGIGSVATDPPRRDERPRHELGPVETIPRGLHPDFLNEWVTVHFVLDGFRRMASIAAPQFSVGYAIVGAPSEGSLDLQIDKPLAIVFARTIADQSCWQALRTAQSSYSQLNWRPLSAIRNGRMPAAPTAYWVQWIVRNPDGSLAWETSSRGIRSLDSVLDGSFGVAESRNQR